MLECYDIFNFSRIVCHTIGNMRLVTCIISRSMTYCTCSFFSDKVEYWWMENFAKRLEFEK